ncbi:polysaccharide lyase family 7 protein [Nevskia ramosa]|uniref:polysaccharide lyase family 7 protein n=1 Tax=Nevskia ramosa TaxID=64002 RepID=UPI003D0A4F7E
MFRATVLVHLRMWVCAVVMVPMAATWAADTAPDAIAFPAVSSAEPGSLVISASQMISGIDAPAPISVSGGSYSVNGGEFVSSPGTVINGSTVRLRQTASTAFYTSTSMKLTLGTPAKTYSFKVTTRKVDTVPDAFSFAPRSEAAFNSVQTSEPTTISGLEAPAAISVSSGSYSINGGEFTTAAGIVANNAQVRARGTASTGVNRTTTVAIKIGGISGTFKITTVKVADTTPNAFSFAPTANAPIGSLQTSAAITVSGINTGAPISVTGGSYSLNGQPFTSAAGTVNNGDSVSVQQTASSSFSTTTTAVLKIGTVSGSYAVTTAAADTTPDAFSFASTVDAPLGSTQTSEAISVSGITAPTPISIVGGYYSVGGGPFSDRASSVVNGDVVRVQQIASSNFSTTATSVLKIGMVGGSYAVTTVAADTTPDAFSFTPTVDAPLGGVQTSEAIMVGGINTGVLISVMGGSYSINGQTFTDLTGGAGRGDSVRVQQAASSDFSTTTTAVLKIGTVSGDYAVTTLAADKMPDTFAFAAIVDAPLGSLQTSDTIIVGGINALVPISITGGSYSLNGRPFTVLAGSARSGDSVKIRQNASSSFSTETGAALTIGNVTATWSVTTLAIDDSADPILFQNAKNAGPGRVMISNTVTVSGINTPVTLAVTGGLYSVDGGAWTAAPDMVGNGAQIRLQLLASSSFGSSTEALLTVAGVGSTFRVSTVPLDKTKDTIIFASVANVAPATPVTSDAVLIAGVNPDSPVSVAGVGGAYSIDGGPFTSEDGVISSGSSVRMRLEIGSSATTATAVFYVGNRSGSFSLSAAATDTAPMSFSFSASTGSDIDADKTKTITVRGINAVAPIQIEGGSYQIGSGPFTSQPGLINEGQTVTVNLKTAHTYSTATELRLTIGGVSAIYRITTSPFAKPSIAPINGVYATAQTVAIKVPGSIPPGAAIYYTTDRSAPTITSIPYSGPFAVRESGIIRAALLSADGTTVGPVTTSDYQIYSITETTPVYVPGGTDLGRWKITLPIGRFARPLEIEPPFLGAGFSSPPYFQPNVDGSLDFSAPVTGVHTIGSSYPRSELREMNADGSLAEWRLGEHEQTLSAALTVTQVPSTGRVVIGQIHADDDGPVLVLLEWRGNQGQPGSLYLSVHVHPDDPGRPTLLASDVPWGSVVTYRIHLSVDGVLSFTGNNRVAVVPINPAWSREDLYFKAGTYVLDNEGPASESGAARFFGIGIAPTP